MADMQKGILTLVLGFGLALLFSVAGIYIGKRLRIRILTTRLFKTDKSLAIPFKMTAIIYAVFLLSQTLIYIPILGLQFVAQGSSILTITDKLTPSSPLEDQASKIAPDQFRNLRLDYDPNPLTYNNISDAGKFQPVVDSVAASVVKISGNKCIGLGFGSGFVAAPNLVVTNAHVIEGSSTIYISDHDGSYPATPMFIDEGLDIAVLYSKFIKTPPLNVASEKAAIGTRSIILGYPGGGDLQMKTGNVTSKNQLSNNPKRTRLVPANTLVFDTAASPGNSGGPVLNGEGQVIGVITASDGSTSIAVSSDIVTDLITKAKSRLIPTRTGFCEVPQQHVR